MKKHKSKSVRMLAGICGMCLIGGMLGGCGSGASVKSDDSSVSAETADTLVYGSSVDYTRINPALDEHGEINLLIFDGLTKHNADNEVEPALAESWDYDEDTHTYTFYLREGVTWHDGEAFTADDVKFTIEAIMDPENNSEIASNYEDITDITVIDDLTVSFTLENTNAAFLDYMTIAILPQHLLEGKDMQTDAFFLNPIGTGPYKLTDWTEGQSITLTANEDYYNGEPNIGTIIFKIVTDDSVRALQLQSGEVNLAQVTPTDAQNFTEEDGYTVYQMTTADYRGILYNFNQEFWQDNREVIRAINYAIDRQSIIDTVLLGEGEIAQSPLQKNMYYSETDGYDYDPEQTAAIMEEAGWSLNDDGIYEKDGELCSFEISVKEGDQVRADMAAIVAQQLGEAGIDCSYTVVSENNWDEIEAFLVGWGSPFDADDHTYKIFVTDQASNYGGYSNAEVDEWLTLARQTTDEEERAEYYANFQQALYEDPAFTFFCYINADYVSNINIQGISEDTVLGHHGVGIFWNVEEWTIES